MPRKEEPKEILGLNRITKNRIIELCKKDKLYQTPELNDVLYLHYQGFECIECLEEYTELKCLWLECNAISEIQGLENQTKLKCLFLQSNLIRKIENLHYCKELDTVNLSQNHIRKIENCGFKVLPLLNTLNLSSNYLKDCDDLKELENCKNLSVLDLSNNRIDDILVVKIFSRMPELKVLVLQGNPVVSKIPQYRKTLILECKKLTYLDSRPVFPKDRACAEAWKRGGYEEERRENERWNRKERKKMRDGVNATIQLRNKNRKPEDQISLIPSSDSEDDLNKKNKIQPNTTELVNSVEPIWHEVYDDKTSNRSLVSEGEHSDISLISNNNCDNDGIPQEIFKKEEIHDILEMNTTNEDINYKINMDDQKKYKPIIDPLDKISRSDYSSKEFQLHIENLSEDDEVEEDNYEPLKELDEIMNTSLKEECEEQSSNKQEINMKLKKSVFDLEILEEQSLKINQEMVTDFEELTSNMNSFIKELDRDQIERQEVINCLFNKKTVSKKSSCEVSGNEEKNCLNELKFDYGLTDQYDEELDDMVSQKIPQQVNINKSSNNGNINVTEMEEFSENIGTKVRNEDLKNLKRSETNPKIFEPVQLNKDSEINVNETKLEFSTTNFNYIPIDILLLTRKSNEALNSLERESKELKKLLLELENKNEFLFKSTIVDQNNQGEKTTTNEENKRITLVQKENYENLCLNEQVESFNKNIKSEFNQPPNYQIQQNNVEIEEIIVEMNDNNCVHIIYTILDDILESLELDKPQTSTISKSFPELRNTFNLFLKNLDSRSVVVDKKASERVIESQKSLILKELSNNSNLKEFNNDTQQSLNAQLEQIRSDNITKVRRIVDRVYAQKDRYNDTLELFDGKLMVRNKDTNELHDLPKPCQQDLSDSETDYDTAQSDQDEKDFQDFQKHQFGRILYKPIKRKSCENIVIKALIENNPNDSKDEFEESNDEFYSLDAGDIPNLYKIDNEFINKLKLDHLNLSQIDQNHITQCARSYEELKNCLKLDKEESSIETELTENMTENCSVYSKENSKNILGNLCNSSLSKCTEIVSETFSKTSFEDNENLKKKISERKNELFPTDDKKIQEIYSEEEKNEIENIDFEYANIESQDPNETVKESNQTTIQISSDNTVNSSNSEQCSLEILEYNLEIADVNEDLVDTITINAKFEF